MMRFAGKLLVAALLLVSACDSKPPQPVEPVWGKQPCEQCAMLLSDKDNGAQLVTADGERLFFDDIGCMAAWTLAHPGSPRASQWVKVASGNEWLPAAEAGYRSGARTPMGYGFIALHDKGDADWAQVLAAVRSREEPR